MRERNINYFLLESEWLQRLISYTSREMMAPMIFDKSPNDFFLQFYALLNNIQSCCFRISLWKKVLIILVYTT